MISKITEIKKIAVETRFWLAGPIDNDCGFGALMKATVIDKKFQDDNAIYLHGTYKTIYLHGTYKNLCSTEVIKDVVRKKAIKLIELLYDVEHGKAEKILIESEVLADNETLKHLIELIEEGYEYPDAEYKTAKKFNIEVEEVTALYDSYCQL
ncbi:hypothetical protein [Enterobacter hormaechei]|uniref:hypothetical protein n=1 Tax=Enterobacter hormaechei TaxID=158836 RepID=UPI00388E7398